MLRGLRELKSAASSTVMNRSKISEYQVSRYKYSSRLWGFLCLDRKSLQHKLLKAQVLFSLSYYHCYNV